MQEKVGDKMQKLRQNQKTIITVVIAVVIAVFISVGSCYVLAESLINSKDVYYKDNSNLLADNVQDAIDGTCTKFENKVDTFLDKIYPIGSIYISATLETPAKVASALGGEWEVYGKGQTIVGVDTNSSEFKKVEQTGGSKSNSTKLTIDNLPSHTHDIAHTHTTPSTTISSSGAHTHSTTAKSITSGLTAESSGDHYHYVQGKNGYVYSDYYIYGSGTAVNTTYNLNIGAGQYGSSIYTTTNGAHTHNVTGTIPALSIASSGAHTHTVPAMTTDTISKATSGVTGGDQAFETSTLQPYITVYMYKRTA